MTGVDQNRQSGKQIKSRRSADNAADICRCSQSSRRFWWRKYQPQLQSPSPRSPRRTYLLCVDPTDVFNRLWAIQGSIHLFETRSICSSILVGRSVIGNIRSRFLFNLCCNVRKQKVKIWNYWFLFLDYVFFFSQISTLWRSKKTWFQRTDWP